jgi:hypothetical protein
MVGTALRAFAHPTLAAAVSVAMEISGGHLYASPILFYICSFDERCRSTRLKLRPCP